MCCIIIRETRTRTREYQLDIQEQETKNNNPNNTKEYQQNKKQRITIQNNIREQRTGFREQRNRFRCKNHKKWTLQICYGWFYYETDESENTGWRMRTHLEDRRIHQLWRTKRRLRVELVKRAKVVEWDTRMVLENQATVRVDLVERVGAAGWDSQMGLED